MTSGLFMVRHESSHGRGAPWASAILGGVKEVKCELCLRDIRIFDVELPITISLQPDKGTYWPDMLGCGAYPLFILSQSALNAWHEQELGKLPIGRIEIAEPLPRRLRNEALQKYHWVDGRQLQAGGLDFAGSGFVGVTRCKACGTHSYDISTTYDLQHSTPPRPYQLRERPELNLFTTDLSPTLFFCSEAVLNLARRYRLTNFRFVPLEWGGAYDGKGVDLSK